MNRRFVAQRKKTGNVIAIEITKVKTMANDPLQLTITHPQLASRGKINLIKAFLQRCSGKVTLYTHSIDDNRLIVSPNFKTSSGLERVRNGITEILNIACEEMDNDGNCCSEHYNCCDCGGNKCGCRYCFSCSACQACLEQA